MPISADIDAVAEQVWSTVSAVVATAPKLMNPLLLYLGVTN